MFFRRRLLERGADFAEFLAEARAQVRKYGDERDCDQRSDQRVFDSGGARIIGDEGLEGLDHDITPFHFVPMSGFSRLFRSRNDVTIWATHFSWVNATADDA
jgi:hypothetical protein